MPQEVTHNDVITGNKEKGVVRITGLLPANGMKLSEYARRIDELRKEYGDDTVLTIAAIAALWPAAYIIQK